MDYKNHRILHEYEIKDASGLHSASVVYLRELTNENTEKTGWMDFVDMLMERSINNNCKGVNRLEPKLIVTEEDVEMLNSRLRNEYQLKGYFMLYAMNELKGGIPSRYSNLTMHATILVKDDTDVPYFENVGGQENVGDVETMDSFIWMHTASPVYQLQEHPLVHGIVCYKDLARKDFMFVLYRHQENPVESILAEIDVANGMVSLKQGTDNQQCVEITDFAASLKAQNNLAPLYQRSIVIASCTYYPGTLLLNKERDLFEKAKSLLLAEIEKKTVENGNYGAMAMYLNKMIEA